MTRRRWIADEVSGNHAALTGEHADHLKRVLRARLGQEFDVVAGPVVRYGRITAIAEGRVEFELGEEIVTACSGSVSLLLSIFKFDRMEWAIEKCSELGVLRIIPAIAQRTDVHLAAAAAKRVDRWRRIALQAAEQSRRPAPPEITSPAKLREAIQTSAPTRIVLSESEQDVQLRDLLYSSSFDPKVVLGVGPEGGWTDEELNLFRESGWIAASLGSTILRAETAAIAATAIAVSALS